MRGEDRALADVASSVADGTQVDWEEADVRVPDGDRRLIPHLRLVENISRFYRTLPDEDAPASEQGPEGAPIERWGPLVLLERIGRGATGEVYRAWDSRLHRDVALKLLHRDQRTRHDAQARVLDEARRLARIRHEQVVSVYGAEEHDGRVGLWMELVRGESLEERVRGRGPLGAAEAAQIGQQLCAALSAVHSAGLLHRDVKAQNVILETSGRTVLTDFGTGEELRQSYGSSRLVGTPLYLAPEIFKGEPATIETDIYSLGVLLFYLVTGEFPVTAGSITELARAHQDGRRRDLDEVRADLAEPFVVCLERALSPRAVDRYHTAADFEAALRSSEPIVASTVATHRSRATPWRWAPMAAGAALLLLVSGLIVWSGSGAGPTASRVAVLPFTYMSDSSDASLVAEVLTDQLIATFGEIDSLQVMAPASVAGFARSTAPTSEIAAALGADVVLRPKITFFDLGPERGRSRPVRIDVDLVAAGTGETLWSKAFTGEFGAIRSLNSAIAREVVRTIRADVTPAVSRRLARSHPTTQATTEAYFEGLYHLKQLTPENVRLAIAAFERAIGMDPQFAPALAGLARAYVDLGVWGAITHTEARALATVHIDRALELDGDSSEVHVASADLKFYYDWNWRGADAEYRRALALNASSDRALDQYARFLAAAGRLDAAIQYAERARDLNPLSSRAALTVALMHLFRREYASALTAIDEAVRRDPTVPNSYVVRSRILAASGAIDDAIGAAEQTLVLSANPTPTWRAHLISLKAHAGRRDEALSDLRQLAAEMEQNRQWLGPEHLGYIYLGLSEPQKALDYFAHAADQRSLGILWFSVDPRIDGLRGDPRFEAILQRLGTL